MKRILDDSLFDLFLQKNCEEVLEEYRDKVDLDSCPLEERLENSFILGCTCILCKYSSARNWLNWLENVNLDGDENLESARSIAVHFLGSHLDRMHLNFSRPLVSGSKYNVAEGFYLAVSSGRPVLAVLFLHLAGWNYAVLGMKDVASSLFSLGIRLARFKNVPSVYAEFCQCGISALEGMEGDPAWNPWTSYFFREIGLSLTRFPLTERPSVVSDFSIQDYYESLFGHLSIESLLDLLEKDPSGLNRSSSLHEYGSNELLYAKLKLGWDISPDELDADSFFVAGPAIDRYYATKTLQEQQRVQFVRAFDTFLDQDGFQHDFKLTPNLLRDALHNRFLSFRERGTVMGEDMVQLIMRMGCGSLYSRISNGFHDPLRKEGVLHDRVMEFSERWVVESYQNCLANLGLLTEEQPDLPLEWRLNLSAHLLQRTGEEKYAVSVSDCIRKSPKLNPINEAASVFEPYDARLANAEKDVLLNHVSIRSVAVERYIEDPAYGRLLETFLSSFDGDTESNKLGLYQFERLALHIDLLETEGWKGRTGLLEGREIFQLDSKDGLSIVFYFLAMEGEWRISDSGLRWEQVPSHSMSIPSPVKALDDYVVSESASLGREWIKVLVPFSNVTFFRTDVFLSRLKDVHVVPLKQLLEKIGASMGSESTSLFRLLARVIPDTDLLMGASAKETDTSAWDFRRIIEFCHSHSYIRKELRSDVGRIERVYDQVSRLGPVALLRLFIRDFVARFPDPDGNVLFSYSCTLPERPYSLIADIRLNDWKIVDFRFDEYSHLSGNTNDLDCRLNGTLLDVGFPYAKFYHRLQITGPASYLEDVFDTEEDDGSIVSQDKRIKTVGRIFMSSVNRFQSVFKGWKGEQEEIFALLDSREYAKKAARAAIMARNMSHNLGSHVMAYLKQHLTSVGEMLKNSVFDQLFASEREFDGLLKDPVAWKNSTAFTSAESVTMPFMVGMGRFLSYLQERQDFIAGIATDYIPPCQSLNFKDFIYDELNPDMRYKRHSDRKGEKPDNLLLGNIARSEGLMRETRPTAGIVRGDRHDIILSFRDFDGNPVEPVPGNASYKPEDQYGGKEQVVKAGQALDDMRKYSLSIPGGITGRHAIFSIVENIIRNAAKHGNWLKKGKLQITFDIYRSGDYWNRASSDDNLPDELSLRQVLERYYAGADDGSSLFFITVTDNLDTTYPRLSKLRDSLVEEYIDESGHMSQTSKGMKEMRICASWLRGFRKIGEEYSPIKTGDHDKEWMNENESWDRHAPALYARLSRGTDSPDGTGHLQFIFAVRIPIRVLIVSNRFATPEYRDLYESFLEENFWYGLTPDEFMSPLFRRNYDFLVFDGDEDAFRRIRTRSSTRLFRASQIPSLFLRLEERETEELNRIYLELWKLISDHTDERLSIVDDKAGKRFPLSEEMRDYVSVGEKIEIGPWTYRRHYESQGEFRGAQDDYLIRSFLPEFVEGISGGNSTDRIVRCEPIDMVWFYKNLHVMKERIAIFDERISNLVFGVDPDWIATSDEELIPCRSYKGMLFSQKRVSVFNFVKVSDETFVMYGIYRGGDDLDFYDPENIVSYCRKIATLSKGSYKLDFIDEQDEKAYRCFDRLSIHQGLLDKFYEAFGIKDIASEKEKLTCALHDAFIITDDKHAENRHFEINGTGSGFLPGMTIHSGRSKPSESDMPQRIPFIQYASLEHAVLDCKYSLVDLLDSASYE